VTECNGEGSLCTWPSKVKERKDVHKSRMNTKRDVSKWYEYEKRRIKVIWIRKETYQSDMNTKRDVSKWYEYEKRRVKVIWIRKETCQSDMNTKRDVSKSYEYEKRRMKVIWIRKETYQSEGGPCTVWWGSNLYRKDVWMIKRHMSLKRDEQKRPMNRVMR